MKFTLSWLSDHLETDSTLPQIADALTDLGLEVEEITDPAEALGAFRIARVIEAAPTPMPTVCACAGSKHGPRVRMAPARKCRSSAARPMPERACAGSSHL